MVEYTGMKRKKNVFPLKKLKPFEAFMLFKSD